MTSTGARRRGRWWLGAAGATGLLVGGGAGAQTAHEELIEEGRRLFLEETFGGNGRTCGTCHPPGNNFTLDPAFIRTLPGNDPLFVAQLSSPQLSALEVRQLLQTSALILENLDGFGPNPACCAACRTRWPWGPPSAKTAWAGPAMAPPATAA